MIGAVRPLAGLMDLISIAFLRRRAFADVTFVAISADLSCPSAFARARVILLTG